jgi:DNA-binding winged helix-turn-helix (wHTH) protein/tetratricopeptide (TPR) repeat protein
MLGSVRFGPFVLDRAAYRLTREGAPIEVAPKSFDLLALFLSRPGELITKDDMLAAIWPGIAVTDNALTQVVSELRQALGDSASDPEFVQTVPRKGYRFIGRVGTPGSSASSDATAPQVREAPAGSVRSVRVDEFENVAGDRELAWLSAGMAETVANGLRAVRGLRVTRRSAAGGAVVDDADVVVAGSFQRAGDRLRVMARATDGRTGDVLATAKADGALAEMFDVQDRLVRELAGGMRITLTPAAAARLTARETSSLDAYRALTEGRLKLETLDVAQVPAAIADFERAIALDPDYALAHAGLAHAQFWRFQASRARTRPDRDALAAAIAHARRAIEIDSELAEAHAALAFFLASADRQRDAIAAGRIAVAIEPANWRHQFRLGSAEWGGRRLECLDVVIAQFPALTYAHFAAAMVHVARGDLAHARSVVEQGVAAAGDGTRQHRFPGRGLDWLHGLIHLAEGRTSDARAALVRELSSTTAGMLAGEFAMDAAHALGTLHMGAGEVKEAAAMFEQALARYPEHARSLVGLAEACARQGAAARARELLERAAVVVEQLRAAGRESEAAFSAAQLALAHEAPADAVRALQPLVDDARPGWSGWTLPIDPGLRPLHGRADFDAILRRLAARAI